MEERKAIGDGGKQRRTVRYRRRWKVKDDKKTMKGCRRMRRTGQVLRKRKNRRCWGAERDWGQQELEENEGA